VGGIMKDPTNETIIPKHTENLVRKAVVDMIILACFELLVGTLLFGFAYLILNELQIDALPPFTVNNYPIFRGIAIILFSLGVVHLLYGIMFNWVYTCKWCRILGIVLAIFSLPMIPTGTFFGMLFVGRMREIRRSTNPRAIEIPEYDKNEIGIEIKTNAAIMAHLPLILYCIYLYLLTIQTDILYPLFGMNVIIAIKVFAFIYGGIFILEVIVGIIFRFYGEKNWEQIILVIFSIFNIVCVAVVIQTYFWMNWTAFDWADFDHVTLMKVLTNFVWVIGIVLNPIGIYFAAHFLRLLKQSRAYHALKAGNKK
jgi:hypothetical protein